MKQEFWEQFENSNVQILLLLNGFTIESSVSLIQGVKHIKNSILNLIVITF